MGKSRSWPDAIANTISKVSDVSAYIAAVLVLGMTGLITYDVVMRYIFIKPTGFTDEIGAYLLVAVIFLGLGYTQKRKRHIEVELVVVKLKPKIRQWLTLITVALALILFSYFTWEIFLWVLKTYKSGERSWGMLLTPLYLPRSFLVLGFAVLSLQLVAGLVRAGLGLKKSQQLPGQSAE